MASTLHSRLISLAFATFHTSLFFLLFVIPTFSAGALGGALATLNTLVGVAIFLSFWFATWIAGQQVLAGVSPLLAERHSIAIGVRKLVVRGVLWGGIEGVLVLFVTLWAFLILSLVASGTRVTLPMLAEGGIFEGISLVVGSPFAFVIGGFVGLLLVIIDLALLGLARIVFSLLQAPGVSGQVS